MTKRSFTQQLFLTAGKLFLIAFFVSIATCVTQAADMKLELKLIWATNDAQSPDPKHKPLDGELAKKMEKMPFKWKNYFEVNRKEVSAPVNTVVKTPLSAKCSVEVKNLGDGRIEVKLIGAGKEVRKELHPLKNGILIVGGNAENDTAWFVSVKEVQ